MPSYTISHTFKPLFTFSSILALHIFEHLNLLSQVWPTNRPTFWRTYLHMTWVGARDACASKKSSTSVWTELVCLCPENVWQSWKEETRETQSKSSPSLTLSLVTYMQHGLAGRRADLVQVLASHLHWLPTDFGVGKKTSDYINVRGTKSFNQLYPLLTITQATLKISNCKISICMTHWGKCKLRDYLGFVSNMHRMPSVSTLKKETMARSGSCASRN